MFNSITVKKNSFIAFIISIFIICVTIATIINTYLKDTETLSNKYLDNTKEYDFDCDGENDQ